MREFEISRSSLQCEIGHGRHSIRRRVAGRSLRPFSFGPLCDRLGSEMFSIGNGFSYRETTKKVVTITSSSTGRNPVTTTTAATVQQVNGTIEPVESKSLNYDLLAGFIIGVSTCAVVAMAVNKIGQP